LTRGVTISSVHSSLRHDQRASAGDAATVRAPQGVTVFLVDGTFELYRCFHGAPRHRTADGREVGAVRGILATFAALLEREQVTHIAVAFDAMVGGRTPATGPKADEALLRGQYFLAEDAVRVLGIPVWPMARAQADDALATAAFKFAIDPRVSRVVICTTDRDLLQCVRGDSVVLLDRIRGVVTDEAAVRARFGVPPGAIPDLHALVGDPSDGLPGVPGWGARSAAAVLSRYGAIESIPRDAAQWDIAVRGAARLARSLLDRRRETLVARDLGRLKLDLALPAAIEEVAWHGPHDTLGEFALGVDAPDVALRAAAWKLPWPPVAPHPPGQDVPRA
jgi:5'-3' exonuclease